MTPRRPELIVLGDVVVAASSRGLERAEAVAIAGGRVIAAGSRSDVIALGGTPRVVDAGNSAVVPGLHDFHIHLVGLARARRAIDLDDARDLAEAASRVRAAADATGAGSWLTGRGWSERQLGARSLAELEDATGGRPVFLMSHDGHSAWASSAARAAASLADDADDPPGGRIERDEHGRPTGILRESALELVQPHVARLQGDALREPLREQLDELAALGLTGATEAGDYTDRNGIGADAAFGDSYSSITDLSDVVDDRFRMTLDIPTDAVAAAAGRGMRTGAPLDGRRTMRFGWAKEYSDGALGSGTAALFEPRSCGEAHSGILRVEPEALDELFAVTRPARIGMAIHAIGDRAVATVLDAMERAPAREDGVPSDRMEHVQLARSTDRSRLAALGMTASVQPIHAAADRDLVDACWAGREHDAYAFRSLLDAGALLAAGSDAPIESVNPWLGIFAAVHRRFPTDARPDWHPEQAISFAEALSAYTRGPALGMGVHDEGHLGAGAWADVAVLNVDLPTLRAADERLAAVRADVTIVGGVIVRG